MGGPVEGNRVAPAWLGPVLVAVSAFAAATLVTLLAMPAPASFCAFTEFGYLGRVVPALAMLGLITISAVIALIGLIRTWAGRGGRITLSVAGGLFAGASIAGKLLEPSCAPA